MAIPTLRNYINGAFVAPEGGDYLDNYNPATGQIYSRLPASGEADVQRAVSAARAAFPEWSKVGIERRFRLLNRLADIIEQNLEEFARAESIDTGKPIQLAREVDIPRAQSNIRFFATSIMHFSSEAHAMEGHAINYTLRQPLGVVGCISPWNLPLYLFTWKIAPALATGNCVVAKPSELTPATANLLAKAAQSAGLPPGVLNIIHGAGLHAGQPIIEHPDVKAVSFTGGTKTGRTIARIAAPALKKVSLELGGKNPNIIFADCDFERAIRTTLKSSYANNGQICLCGSRIFIQQSIYEAFRDEFVKRTQFLKVGDPLAKITDQGAIISAQHLEKIKGYVQLAQQEGGKILTGGSTVQLTGDLRGGYYYRPTIVEGLTEQCRVNQEEIFGPVVTLQPFDTEAEALRLANSVEYGLSATVWTNSIRRAHRMAESLQAGIVWINCWMVRDLRTPFGGAKNSGMGREGGLEALRFFTEPKNVCVQYNYNL